MKIFSKIKKLNLNSLKNIIYKKNDLENKFFYLYGISKNTDS